MLHKHCNLTIRLIAAGVAASTTFVVIIAVSQ
jgi:hypothetical protein